MSTLLETFYAQHTSWIHAAVPILLNKIYTDNDKLTEINIPI